MREYLDQLSDVLHYGYTRGDRTGTGTVSLFGPQYWVRMHSLGEGLTGCFPLLTTKKMFFRGIVAELLWFLSGSTDNRVLQEQGVRIWDAWATKEQTAKFGREEGDLGPVYGHQWRNFGATKLPDGTYAKDGKDQIAWLIEEIRRNPNSRRLLVSAWNPIEADQVELPPCHTLFQFYVRNSYLDCKLYQRSGDAFLGVPFNLASYALLQCMVAHVTGLDVGRFIHSFGDLHIYSNHMEQVKEQLGRKPKDLPTLRLNPHVKDIFAFTLDDIFLDGYDYHAPLKGAVAV